MPLNERSSSLNTYAFPKIFYRSHMMEYRVKDYNYFEKQGNKWLFADILEKPTEIVKYRKKTEGGLGLHHIRSKSMAILIKTFMETTCQKQFLHSLYHQALLAWHVLEDRSMPDPGNSPYYSQEFYNHIRSAVNKELKIETMSSKEWYEFILSSLLRDPGEEGLVPCRVELLHPGNDWQTTWELARLRGLSSESLTFLWLMLHGLLPTRDRLFRILPTVSDPNCRECGEPDSIKHALTECQSTRPVFVRMRDGLRKVNSNLTEEKILLLDMEPNNLLTYLYFIRNGP